MLLAAGATLEARDKWGLLAKDCDCRGAGVIGREVAEKSLARGGTPLHSAANNGYVKVVKLLLQEKASVTVKDNYGRGPRLGHVLGL